MMGTPMTIEKHRGKLLGYGGCILQLRLTIGTFQYKVPPRRGDSTQEGARARANHRYSFQPERSRVSYPVRNGIREGRKTYPARLKSTTENAEGTSAVKRGSSSTRWVRIEKRYC